MSKRRTASKSRTKQQTVAKRRTAPVPAEAGRAQRVLPPVSAATGGVEPGIDLNDMAALQEMDDLDEEGWVMRLLMSAQRPPRDEPR